MADRPGKACVVRRHADRTGRGRGLRPGKSRLGRACAALRRRRSRGADGRDAFRALPRRSRTRPVGPPMGRGLSLAARRADHAGPHDAGHRYREAGAPHRRCDPDRRQLRHARQYRPGDGVAGRCVRRLQDAAPSRHGRRGGQGAEAHRADGRGPHQAGRRRRPARLHPAQLQHAHQRRTDEGAGGIRRRAHRSSDSRHHAVRRFSLCRFALYRCLGDGLCRR